MIRDYDLPKLASPDSAPEAMTPATKEPRPAPKLDTRLALRAKEAAAALGISERKLRDVAPRLPVVWMDGIKLFPVEGLREWLRTETDAQAKQIEAEGEQIVRSLRRVPKTEDTAES